MKFTQFTLAAAVLATVAAQGLDSLPDCSKTCATSAIPASCGLNVQCICSDKAFLSSIACCVAGKCSQADQETTLQVAKGICSRGGVTDLPSTISCSTGSSTATGTAASATTTGSSSETKTESSSETKTGSASTATDTTLSGSVTATTTGATTTGASTTGSAASSSSASHSASSAAATTGAAVLGQTRDSSLMAAAGAAAAFAIFV